MSQSPTIFDRRLLRQRRARSLGTLAGSDFLFSAVADDLRDRLGDVLRTFPVALELGARARVLDTPTLAAKGIETALTLDLALPAEPRAHGLAAVADEEWLPIATASLDLVVSALTLHWTNDLVGALVQLRRALKPDGMIQLAILGGETLIELREVLVEAEVRVTGGAALRVSPMVELADMAGLLQRAGFALPVADEDRFTVTYAHVFDLFRDLRAMGETAAFVPERRHPLRRAVLAEAGRLYHQRHGEADGRISATFQVLHAAGWAPAPTQQQPARRGSATHRLADALGTDEVGSGIKAGR